MRDADDARIQAEPFAVYLTGSSSIEELQRAISSGLLSADAALAIHVLDAALESGETRDAVDELRDRFAEFDSEAQLSRANVLRTRCGGVLEPLPNRLGPLTEQLAVLARDFFPLFLLQPSRQGYLPVDPYEAPFWMKAVGLRAPRTPHPAATRFTALVENTPSVQKAILGDRLEWHERVDVGRFRTGWIIGSDVSSLYCHLLDEAFRATAGTGSFTPDRFIQRALVELHRFARTLSGEPVEITVLHGLDGIYLGDDVTIEVPWGIIRPLRAEEVFLLEDWRHQPEFVRPTAGRSVVLEASATLQRLAGEDADEWSDRPRTVGLNIIERLQLALLLASGGAGTVTPVWTVSPDARHLEESLKERDSYLQAYTASTIGRVEDESILRAIRDWAARIEANHESALDIAARRLLRARLERAQPDDALVDAVIALEALFAGSSRTEITFRVSSAAAWLLAPDDAGERLKIVREVKSLYGLRSGIVHGSAKHRSSGESVWEQQNDAVAPPL